MAETMGLVCMAEAQAVLGFRAETKGSRPGTVATLMVGASGEHYSLHMLASVCQKWLVCEDNAWWLASVQDYIPGASMATSVQGCPSR